MRADLIASSKVDDLAILKISSSDNLKAISFRSIPVRLGSSVATFGFPLVGALSSGGNFSVGSVTGLSGLRDDSRFLQISAPVQPGNSGGALLDDNANLAGIVSSKMDAVRVAQATGDIPQNVNFAIRSNIVMNFLDANGITYQLARDGTKKSETEIATFARQISVKVTCFQ
jgi:S1-C subfamily serine protease